MQSNCLMCIDMKLSKFIDELQSIARRAKNPQEVEVRMADSIPVVKPILKKGTVYITDISPAMNRKLKSLTL